MNSKEIRPRPYHLVKKLLQYDVVSFDIFDTLILRPFLKPTDLFLTLSPHHNIPSFRKNRIEAERRARIKSFEDNGTYEITIFDIYKELERNNSIEVEYGVSLEVEAEKSFCYANPYMKLIYEMLLQNNKTIIFTSNMYLPSNLMKELLSSCGYNNYDKLYVSCDYGVSKTDSTLFKIIEKDFPKDTKFIHVGDNYNSDIKGSQKIGWDSYHYQGTHDIQRSSLRHLKQSTLLNSFYNAIIENYFNNGNLYQYPYNTPEYFYGFTYGGLLVLGYVNFIHKYAKDNKLDRLLFLSRDGHILKRTYDALYDDIPSEYVLWSRHASIKNGLTLNVKDFLTTFLYRRHLSKPDLSLRQGLIDMGLPNFVNKLENYNINPNDPINKKENHQKLEELFFDHKHQLARISEEYSKASEKYFNPLLKDSRNIGIVDIGWRGTGGINLKELIENKWNYNCNVHILLGGNYTQREGYDTSFVNKGIIESFMFSDVKNRDLALMHQSRTTIANCIIEILTTAPMPSFLNFEIRKDSYKRKFDKPESENLGYIELIQCGEKDFICEFISHSESFPELQDLCGRDVYLPLTYLYNDQGLKDFRKVFYNYTFPRYVGSIYDKDITLLETLGDIFDNN
jgi:HAD superfamily hydrolase (TIGR01549 family)